MQTDDKAITFVVTCRGRLHHLKESLPRLVQQAGTEVVVVDYGCPDRSGDWVRGNHPGVKVVSVPHAEKFELARARNFGARAAQTPWLCFIDADALVEPDFARRVIPLLGEGRFLRGVEGMRDSMGQCVCRHADFDAVGGYDAVMQGWGMEDKDFYVRLGMHGLQAGTLPAGVLSMLNHRDAARVMHYDNKHPMLNSTLNLVYCRAKWDLAKLGVDVSREAFRSQLYSDVIAAVEPLARAGKAARVEVPVGGIRSVAGAALRLKLCYELEPPPPDVPGYKLDAGREGS